MSKIPCKLDDISCLLPFLKKGKFAVVSDDKQGFFHLQMHRKCQGLLQFHMGDEGYQYVGMPFGIPTAPGVYQMLNNTISSLLRCYGILNCLYIDDRCLLQNDSNPIGGWLMTALSCCSGHFLSLNKSGLIPRQEFDFLGIHIDCKTGYLSIPSKKQESFRELALSLLAAPDRLPFHDLEKFRGRAVSFLAVIPYMALFTR